MAPRPFLVSGGAQDRPEHWTALNHTIALNEFLVSADRVAMTMRDGHTPTAESNAQVYTFLERFLKPWAHAGYRIDSVLLPGGANGTPGPTPDRVSTWRNPGSPRGRGWTHR